jgi:type I restriction-modification system DNA methylase subunit
MDTNAILDILEYKGSPCFLEGSHLDKYPAYSHIFRRARKFCNLQGVYTLKEQTANGSKNESIIPIVYVCETDTKTTADEIHKLVWNQNVVPFLLVATPSDFRLYRGFQYDAKTKRTVNTTSDQSIFQVAKDAKQILNRFADFKAESINNGNLFKNWSKDITADTRVDWKLLDSLKKLSKRLITPMLPRNIAHILIGKYVYLRYLRDRNILSDRKFDEWEIKYEEIFGRNAKLTSLYLIEAKLDNWLNGSVFPLPQKGTFEEEHVREVASTFIGYDPSSGQMHFDFGAYDFQHIPIETLSVVYEQFLHAEGQGREKGAYYTPIHLVNFMLDELDAKQPLKKRMKVFDASCGSGAFLVQCYRRLIERTFIPKLNKGLDPEKLSDLLSTHIYGLEADEDACGVTELSLILTLLDYVDPPDLSKYDTANNKRPLPRLRDRNIFFCSKGFFDPDSKWEKNRPKDGYEWIVGNPPWKGINAENIDELEPSDEIALQWMGENKAEFPVSDNQLAEAFAWKVTRSLSEGGLVGLLLPAATLFKKSAKKFRTRFFAETKTWCVVNFANLRHFLFRDAEKPAAAFFYSLPKNNENLDRSNITTYAPFAVDQLNRYAEENRTREEAWTIIVNDCGIKEIPNSEAIAGGSLPWKLAMWGTIRDKHLLSSVASRFDSFLQFANNHNITVLEGPQLKKVNSIKEAKNLVFEGKLKFIKELVGEKRLDMDVLKGRKYMFSFPKASLIPIDSNYAYIRVRGGEKPLEVCKPPHIIVDAARKFSVFSDKFIVVPPRQIGIAGKESEKLKALCLYLNSDFVYYHQFLTSETSLGIERDVTNKNDLLKLPIPLDCLSTNQISDWAQLHNELVDADAKNPDVTPDLFVKSQRKNILGSLLYRMNQQVYSLLGIDKFEQNLIDDFLQTRMKLNEGAIAQEAVKPATKSEMLSYATVMKNELDGFLNGEDKHKIKVYYSIDSVVVEINHLNKSGAGQPEIIEVDSKTQATFEGLAKLLSKEQGQWIYFNRGLRIFTERTTCIFKPRQRLYWLKSQALVDADEFLADKLATLQAE